METCDVPGAGTLGALVKGCVADAKGNKIQHASVCDGERVAQRVCIAAEQSEYSCFCDLGYEGILTPPTETQNYWKGTCVPKKDFCTADSLAGDKKAVLDGSFGGADAAALDDEDLLDEADGQLGLLTRRQLGLLSSASLGAGSGAPSAAAMNPDTLMGSKRRLSCPSEAYVWSDMYAEASREFTCEPSIQDDVIDWEIQLQAGATENWQDSVGGAFDPSIAHPWAPYPNIYFRKAEELSENFLTGEKLIVNPFDRVLYADAMRLQYEQGVVQSGDSSGMLVFDGGSTTMAAGGPAVGGSVLGRSGLVASGGSLGGSGIAALKSAVARPNVVRVRRQKGTWAPAVYCQLIQCVVEDGIFAPFKTAHRGGNPPSVHGDVFALGCLPGYEHAATADPALATDPFNFNLPCDHRTVVSAGPPQDPSDGGGPAPTTDKEIQATIRPDLLSQAVQTYCAAKTKAYCPPFQTENTVVLTVDWPNVVLGQRVRIECQLGYELPGLQHGGGNFEASEWAATHECTAGGLGAGKGRWGVAPVGTAPAPGSLNIGGPNKNVMYNQWERGTRGQGARLGRGGSELCQRVGGCRRVGREGAT